VRRCAVSVSGTECHWWRACSDLPGARISVKPVLLSLRGANVAEVPHDANSAAPGATPFALQLSTPTKSFVAYVRTHMMLLLLLLRSSVCADSQSRVPSARRG
jgi:hypothetical protein